MRKSCFCLTATFLLIIRLAAAQPSVDGKVEYTNAASQTSHTTGSVTPSGSNRALWMCITTECAGLDKTVTSANFNTSESFTLLGSSITEDPTGTAQFASVWYLPNPSATTATIMYTHTAACPSVAVVLRISNAQQSTPTLENEDVSGTTTVSADLTTTVDNTLLLTCAISNLSGATHSHGTGQTEESDISANSATQSTSSEVKTTAGLETLTTTSTSGTNFLYVVTGIAPPGVASQTRRRVPIVFR
jgi:hypothetical protein